MSEVKKYLPYIIKKSELSEEELKNLLNRILETLHLINRGARRRDIKCVNSNELFFIFF